MPYRRLPNTDSARIRALRKALAMGNEIPPHKLAFSSKTLMRAQKLLPVFENSVKQQRQFLNAQAKKVKDYDEIARKARIYLSHFVRVMNMAVYRGEIPAETRAFYGLPTNESSAPSFNTANELVSWGKRIIEGEAYRIKKGGTPITNPTIAVVKVRYEKFLEALEANRKLAEKADALVVRNKELRKEADDIIVDIWNDVEKYYSGNPDIIKRKKCGDYGIMYYLRKGEPALAEISEKSAT